MHRKSAHGLINLVALLLGALPVLVYAQSATGNLAEVWVMTVKRGEQANFEAQKQIAVRAQNNDPRSWNLRSGLRDGAAMPAHCCLAGRPGLHCLGKQHPAVMGLVRKPRPIYRELRALFQRNRHGQQQLGGG
jgi:hypothetical protein